MLLHCVFIRFKSSLSLEEKQEIYLRIIEIQRLVEGVLDVKAGPNTSFQGLHGGFHDGFIVTLEDDRALEAFVTHPRHEALDEALLEMTDGGLSGIIVFDMPFDEV